MSTADIYMTAHRGLAATLLYSLGEDALVTVTVEDGDKVVYTFTDDGTVHEIKRDFFNGGQIADAFALLECGRKVHWMAADAKRASVRESK